LSELTLGSLINGVGHVIINGWSGIFLKLKLTGVGILKKA